MEIGRTSRNKSQNSPEKFKELYSKLLSATGRVVGQATRFVNEIAEGVKRSSEALKQAALEGLKKEMEAMLPRVQQVMHQAKAKVLGGDTRVEGKLVSLFEPSTEIIRRGRPANPRSSASW